MIQSSHLRSIFLSALFALLFVVEPSLSGSLWAAEEKKIEFPAASQHATVKQRVGLTDIEVDYSRPNKNNRDIFGGLCYGKLWRTGANAVTKIRFSKAVTLGGKEIPAGEYALSRFRQRTSGPSSFRKTQRCRARPITSRRTMPPVSRRSRNQSPSQSRHSPRADVM